MKKLKNMSKVIINENTVKQIVAETVKRILSETRESDFKHYYMLLGRLEQDCKYYLGYGNRFPKHLWAGDEQAQIDKMRELYDMLPVKPEWITPEDIDNYAREMGVQ